MSRENDARLGVKTTVEQMRGRGKGKKLSRSLQIFRHEGRIRIEDAILFGLAEPFPDDVVICYCMICHGRDEKHFEFENMRHG